MDVIIYDHDSGDDQEEVLETREIPTSQIEPFIELVRKYGYLDLNGETYLYEYAQVEPEGIVIYLRKKRARI